jgi:hypothetical protein
MIIKEADIKRFWSKVDKRSDDECWNWLPITSTEYGVFWLGWENSGNVNAHQVSYFLHYNVDPRGGKHVHHTCENKKCVNPLHLTLMTASEHMLAGNSRPASQARQTHCKRGHEFTEENTYVYLGMRHCRKCHVLHQRKHVGSELK